MPNRNAIFVLFLLAASVAPLTGAAAPASLCGDGLAPVAPQCNHVTTSRVVSVSAGASYTCAIVATGDSHCWGYNGSGQAPDTTGRGYTQVATGSDYSCALRTNGTVDCVGTGLTRGYVGGDVVQLEAGIGQYPCARLSSGNVFCWSSNSDGYYQLADATSVAANADGMCALRASGHVKCFGGNWNGEMVDDDAGDAVSLAMGQNSRCIIRQSGNADCLGSQGVRTFENVSQVAIGSGFTCALGFDSNVACAGDASFGKTLGYQGGDAVAVTTGDNHACVLREDGTVACWGLNNYGQSHSFAPATTAADHVLLSVDVAAVATPPVSFVPSQQLASEHRVTLS